MFWGHMLFIFSVSATLKSYVSYYAIFIFYCQYIHFNKHLNFRKPPYSVDFTLYKS